MSGFILKDLYIIRKRLCLLICYLLGIMLVSDTLFISLKNLTSVEDATFIIKANAVSSAFVIFILIYYLECSLLDTDERRKWNAYSASSEAGTKAVVGAKYTLCFMISFIGYLICRLNDLILSLAAGRTIQLSYFYLGLLFVISFIMAFQLYFGIRFGAKSGTNIRIALFVGLFILGALYGLFGDLDWLMAKGGVRDHMRYLMEHMDDAGVQKYLAKLSGGVVTVFSLIPHCIVALYYISYRLSCKVYTKGAWNYDK